MKLRKLVLISLITLMVAACASKPAPIAPTITDDVLNSKGEVVRTITKQDGRVYENIALANAQTACVQALAGIGQITFPDGASTVEMALISSMNVNTVAITSLSQALVGEGLCTPGTNSYDVEMVRLQENTKRLGLIKDGLIAAGGFWLGSRFVDALAATKGGIELIGDNNEIRSNTGDGADFVYEEQAIVVPPPEPVIVSAPDPVVVITPAPAAPPVVPVVP